MFDSGKEGELNVTAATVLFWRDFGSAFVIEMFRFQLCEYLFGSLVHFARHAGQSGDVNPVTFVRGAGNNLCKNTTSSCHSLTETFRFLTLDSVPARSVNSW